jgi:hypothetical protein
MQFLLDDLAWEQLDPAGRQEVLEDPVVEAVEDCSSACTTPSWTPLGRALPARPADPAPN